MMTFEEFTDASLRLLQDRYTSIQRTVNEPAFEIDFEGRTARVERVTDYGYLLTLSGGPKKFRRPVSTDRKHVKLIAEEIIRYFED